MAFTWANIFAPPTGDTGLNNGTFGDVDEWPFSDADDAWVQNDVTEAFTGIDLSSGSGDKKGFRVWIRMSITNASPTVDLTFRLLEAGTTELWAPGVVATVANTSFKTFVFDIPDSAFSGDPDIDNLSLEFTTLRTAGGNQRLNFSGLRISKSPFTAAQEASLPSDLGSADFSCYRADDLALLGAADAEAVVVWPDASGNGRHLVRQAGTDVTFEDDTEDYVYFAGAGSRLMTSWAEAVTGNHLWHIRLFPEDTTITQGVWSHALDFVGAAVPGDKNILGIDDAGSGDKFLLMSGDGSGPVHLYGATTVTFDAWVRITQWVQDSGNEHLWFEDDASPDIDDVSGANNLLSVSVGNRESNDRPFQGRISELWIVDAAGLTETNIDDARDEWVNGPGGTPATVTPSAIATSSTVPGPTAIGGTEVAPDAVTTTSTVPGPTATGAALRSPAAIATVSTVPGPTAEGPGAVSPTQIPTVTAIPTPDVSVGVVITPDMIATSTSVLMPTATGAALVTPSVIPTDSTVPDPTVAVQSEATVTPNVILTVTAIPSPTPSIPGSASPGSIATVTVMPAPTPVGGTIVMPDVIATITDVLIPLIGLEVLAITALGFAQFHRIGTNLVLSPVGRSTRVGFKTVEGFDRVSDVFRIDNLQDGDATATRAMTTVAAVWAAHSASSTAVLKAEIHEALAAVGFRRANGTSLV
jgi:hypothetical protein